MQLPYDEGHTRRRIYLVRHGHAMGEGEKSARYTTDVTLTAQGILEAESTREYLREIPFDEAWSSDITRAQETARMILQPHRLELQTSPVYREIAVDLSTAMNGSDDAMVKLRGFAYDLWSAGRTDARIFGVGESYREYCDRAFSAMDALALGATGNIVLLVAHSGFNRAALCWATGSTSLAAFGAFEQDHCGVNIIDVDIDQASRQIVRRHVRLSNYTAWDPDKRTLRLTDTEVMAEKVSSLLADLQAR
ncbi:MAG: histidine phosphatase family protein [Panacagrimonas sp.]